MRTRMGAIAAIGLVCLAIGSCGKQASTTSGKPKVAVSIFPLYDVVKRIAGDRVDVLLVLPPGRSEHGYDPSPKEMERFLGTRLAIFVGLGMDDWARKIVKGASPQTTILTLGPFLDPLKVELEHTGEAHEEEEEEEEGHHDAEPGAPDPHFWLDPVRMQKAVDLVVQSLGRDVDPAGQAEFAQRGEALKQALADLHASIERRSKAWTRRTIVTFHGSMGYFAARYGLKIAAIIEPFPGREPTPKYLEQVLAAIKSSGAAALFSEPQLDKGPAQVIADQARVPLFELDPVGGTAGRDSYEKLLSHNADVLDRALGKP